VDGVLDTTLTDALTVLSAMLTPAILISACGSLSISTSQRVSRLISRTRAIVHNFEELSQNPERDYEYLEEESEELTRQIAITATRARILQWALAMLYVAIGFFVATSVAIGVVSILRADYAVLALMLGMMGATVLLVCIGLLIFESRLAVRNLTKEMRFLARMSTRCARSEDARCMQD
jgi:ABC-type siderophore export system fused ATPase/permease subunit